MVRSLFCDGAVENTYPHVQTTVLIADERLVELFLLATKHGKDQHAVVPRF